jgi:hypothetical protein
VHSRLEALADALEEVHGCSAGAAQLKLETRGWNEWLVVAHALDSDATGARTGDMCGGDVICERFTPAG